MSPVFRHGRLRLYLLKLLDEAPRHGYEVIRLLQDRFMGVYAPSPGTIYPRLARLEEDGLVTHEEVDGKKVYSITDKGREEIRGRLGELADLEDELTESLRDVARGISEDVRDTVRSIREELASAAREFRNADVGRAARLKADPDSAQQDPGRREPGDPRAGARDPSSDETQRIRDEARRAREQMRADFRAQARNRGDWAAWQERHGRHDWTGWSWSDWARDFGEQGKPGARDQATAEGESDTRKPGDGERPKRGGANPFSDLERIAIQFATELRAAAKQTGNIGERSLNDLRDILTDTLAKVRAEVFADAGRPGDGTRAAPAESGAADAPAGGADTKAASGEAAAGPDDGAAAGPSADATDNGHPAPGTS
ncbi:MAG: PadR family transcriptional regulator [Streptosporangiaceae bacterium]